MVTGTPANGSLHIFKIIYPFPVLMHIIPKLVSFVPLHAAATALLELRHASGIFAHLVHPRPVPWRRIIEYVAAIIDIPVIPYDEWLRRLEASPKTSEALHNNPALHLLDFYYASRAPKDRSDLSRREAMGLSLFETRQTVVDAPTLKDLAQLDMEEVSRWIDYWKSKGALDQ